MNLSHIILIFTVPLIVAACIFINRIRGGLFNLRPRAIYYAGPMIAVACYATFWFSWYVALILGAGFLIWGFPGWHIWIQPTFTQPTDKDPFLTRLLNTLGFRTWFGGFFLRHFLCLIPLGVGLYFTGYAYWLIAPLSVALVMSYWLSYQIHGKGDGIGDGENFAGGFWGLFVVALHMLHA